MNAPDTDLSRRKFLTATAGAAAVAATPASVFAGMAHSDTFNERQVVAVFDPNDDDSVAFAAAIPAHLRLSVADDPMRTWRNLKRQQAVSGPVVVAGLTRYADYFIYSQLLSEDRAATRFEGRHLRSGGNTRHALPVSSHRVEAAGAAWPGALAAHIASLSLADRHHLNATTPAVTSGDCLFSWVIS